MRVRKLSPTGDYSFGSSRADFFVNDPAGVAQVVQTRLSLWLGEWFLDTTEGTDWLGQVLGNRTVSLRDAMIRARVLATPDVQDIEGYSSTFDRETRTYGVTFRLNTVYGEFGRFTAAVAAPVVAPAQPPAAPVGVAVTEVGDTALNIAWTPYTPP